jgi:uncharacterized protein (TIGR02679 family)
VNSADLGRLDRLLGGQDLAWVIERLRRRIERRVPLAGVIVLSQASSVQRRAVERLLGRPAGRGSALSVDLRTLAAVLSGAGAAPDLRSAVEAMMGPIPDRLADREARESSWTAALAPLEAIAANRPALVPWLEWLASTGHMQRVAHGDAAVARQLANQAVGVLGRLPADGVPISVLANLEAGGGHALDSHRPLSALVLPAVARIGGVPPGEGAEWRRTAWAAVGVLCGELTSPVLTLNLGGDRGTPTGRVLRAWSQVGEPVHLTARQLVKHPPGLDALRRRQVYLCENPTVVAEAANRLGAESAPLVCTSSHPAAAATTLLRLLTSAGAELVYHGDFDWPGLTIANGIITRFGARPWRMDGAAYRRAAKRGGGVLRGEPVAATWDRDLHTAMQEIGVRVEEENVLDDLLADLSPAVAREDTNKTGRLG